MKSDLHVPPQSWHAECQRLHDSGMNVADIKRAIGRSSHVIRIFLDIKNARAKEAARRGVNAGKGSGRRADSGKPPASNAFIAHRRTVAPGPANEDRARLIREATAERAAGTITAAEFSARLDKAYGLRQKKPAGAPDRLTKIFSGPQEIRDNG